MSRLDKKDTHEAMIVEIANEVLIEALAEFRALSRALDKLAKLELKLVKVIRIREANDIQAAQEERDIHQFWCIKQFPDHQEEFRTNNNNDT